MGCLFFPGNLRIIPLISEADFYEVEEKAFAAPKRSFSLHLHFHAVEA